MTKPNKQCQDKDWLYDQYITQGKSTNQIAKDLEAVEKTYNTLKGRNKDVEQLLKYTYKFTLDRRDAILKSTSKLSLAEENSVSPEKGFLSNALISFSTVTVSAFTDFYHGMKAVSDQSSIKGGGIVGFADKISGVTDPELLKAIQLCKSIAGRSSSADIRFGRDISPLFLSIGASVASQAPGAVVKGVGKVALS